MSSLCMHACVDWPVELAGCRLDQIQIEFNLAGGPEQRMFVHMDRFVSHLLLDGVGIVWSWRMSAI